MAEMFNSAEAYSRAMGRWSARLAPLFLEFARIPPGGDLLDVGCGTGNLAEVLARLGGGSRIVGIDPARAFVEYCRQRLAGPRFSFDCGNAMALPYPDDSYDHSLSLLVFQFVADPAKAAAEMRRVTRAGGTLAACTWDSRDGGLVMSEILWQEAARVDPVAASRAEKSRHCTRRGELAALWRATGLDAVEETEISLRTGFASFDDYWLPYLGGAGAPGAYVAGMPADGREALREALRGRILGDGPDRPFSFGARAWAVRGIVPRG